MKKILLIIFLMILSFTALSCGPKNPPEEKNDAAIKEVIDLINGLPETIVLDNEVTITLIRQKYDALDIKDKAEVTNYKDFILDEKALAKLLEQKEIEDEAKTVDDIIGAIGECKLDNISEIENNIKAAKDAYNKASEDAKELVTKYEEISEKEEMVNFFKSVITIRDEIRALIPNDVQLEDEVKLNQALEKYNSTSEEVKKYLGSELESINAGLDYINDIKKEAEYKEKAKVVIDLIDAIPALDKLTLDDTSTVNKAKNRYYSLAADAKKFVTNLDKLDAAVEKIDELTAIKKLQDSAKLIDDTILALPSVDALTLDDEQKVNDCLDLYNSASSEVKQYITKYSIIEDLLEKLVELHANYEYTVKLYLNGGTIEGLSPTASETEIYSFSCDSYSTGFWTGYGTQSFIFKTSLINADDTYASAYKIGFSFDNESGKYVIDQIIPNGTGLNEDNKTSEYFIFVHPDYSDVFNGLKVASVGNIVTSEKEFPISANSSFNSTVKIKMISQETNYISVKYKGVNTLSVPYKFGYIFSGWYTNSHFSGYEVKEVSDNMTLYAKWIVNAGEVTTDEILNCVSDIATSYTLDNLIASNDDASFTWSSSNPKLYTIVNGIGQVSRQYQTHQTQKVTITCNIKYNSGATATKSKEITIDPVTYDDFPSTPIATYFSTGAAYSYKNYSTRYQTERTMFSESSKEALDIVYYAFVSIDANGGCKLNDASYVDEITAMKDYNVRIIASISGTSATTCQYFTDICKDDTKRATFVKNLMDLCDQYRFDGLDIDWESADSSHLVNATGMNALSRDLKAEMERRQAPNGSPYLLTAAVPASSWGLETTRFDLKTLNKYLDFINIMSYDANKSDVCSHVCPLHSSGKDKGYGFGGVYGVEQMSTLGFDKSKLLIGCAGYGKAYKVTGSIVSDHPGLGATGTLTKIASVEKYGSFASGTLYGGAILKLLESGNYKAYDESNGKNYVGSYLYSVSDKIFVTYESAYSIEQKYEYASKIDGCGLMCWCSTEDTGDTYLNAISNVLNK